MPMAGRSAVLVLTGLLTAPLLAQAAAKPAALKCIGFEIRMGAYLNHLAANPDDMTGAENYRNGTTLPAPAKELKTIWPYRMIMAENKIGDSMTS